jgi:hypothetical protein
MKSEGKSQQKVRTKVKLPPHGVGLPGNDNMIIGSAFLPAYKAGHPADLPVKKAGLLLDWKGGDIGKSGPKKE